MSYAIKINIDTRRIETYIKSGIDKANKELIPIITQYAKTHHRYNNITGNLSNSVVVRDIRLGLEITAASNYAEYIHDGHGTWAPDRWLEKALFDNEQLILTTYEKFIDSELRRM